MTTNELLRRYVNERSEPAFEELVKRHIALVYSAALRLVNGNVPAAQDVTQAVFTDLARKAPRLIQHTSLAGWLYTSTRYVAAKSWRAEQRRRSYEQEAHEMNQILQLSEPDTASQQLRSLLDDAMHDLSAIDREVVLLRYFESLPLAEISVRLGLKENTARMRIERAMDRLRAALAKRGVTSTITALTAVLTSRAVGGVPPGMAAQVSRTALANLAATGGLTWALLKLAGLIKGNALVAAGMAILMAGVILVPKILSTGATATRMADTATDVEKTAAQLASNSIGAVNAMNSAPANNLVTTNGITLHIVADDTGKSIAGAKIECLVGDHFAPEERAGGRKPLLETQMTATDDGVCEVPIPRDRAGMLSVHSRTDGFVETGFSWNANRGDSIPQEYTLRLTRATPIGGLVVNENGQPVAGANVTVENRSFQPPGPDVPHIGRVGWVGTLTDADGRWHLNRFAKDDIGKLIVMATHAAYATNDEMMLIRREVTRLAKQEAEQQLLAGTYIYTLDHGAMVEGAVADTEGQPVSNVKVVIQSDLRSYETTNLSDGHFTLCACKVGANQIDAQAPGFTPATLKITLTNDQKALLLTLKRARPLRLRVVDINGSPIANAVLRQNILPPPSLLHDKSDADGRITWDSPPGGEVFFNISAVGYSEMMPSHLKADGEEHLIALHAPRTISGSVHDGATGLPVPRFLIATGEVGVPYLAEGTNVYWDACQVFQGGDFRYLDDSPGAGAKYKFEAAGYAPFVTRVVGQDEGGVSFDITLYPASSTRITVVLPDGQPAANASIGLQMPGANLLWESGDSFPGGFGSSGWGHYTNTISTDQSGQFDLPPDDAVTKVIAASPVGYAEATPASLTAEPTMRLQPWGRIEGTLLSEGKPVRGQLLQVNRLRAQESQDSVNYFIETETDSGGHFVFARVPSGEFRLFHPVTPPDRLFHVVLAVPMTVHLGETSTVSLELYSVSARLRWPAGVEHHADWHMTGTIELPPLSRELSPIRVCNFSETEDGTWRAEDVPAGNYTVRFSVLAQPSDGIKGKPLLQAELPLVVPDNPPDGMVDVGEILLKPVP